MDKKGFISIEYLFLIFIVLIIAVGLLFFTSASIGSTNNIADNVEHSSIWIYLDSKPGFYEIDVEKNKLTIEFSNKKGETLVLPLKIESKYKLYSGRSYLISKNDDGEIVIK